MPDMIQELGYESVLICLKCDERMKIIWIEGEEKAKGCLDENKPVTACWKCLKCNNETHIIE